MPIEGNTKEHLRPQLTNTIYVGKIIKKIWKKLLN